MVSVPLCLDFKWVVSFFFLSFSGRVDLGSPKRGL